MGTLFSALDIGRAGLMIAQVQLDVTGHNIANVNNEGFSRQRVELTTRLPNFRSYGAVGRGPAIETITRLRETFLDQIYRDQVEGLGSQDVQAGYYTRIEEIFQEPTEDGFSTRLTDFQDALHDYANNVESLSVRISTVTEADALANSLNTVARELNTLRTNANEEVRNLVDEINSLSERIANLNGTIRRAEFGGDKANDLRDERDVLIDELAQLVQINARERDDGQMEILIGGDTLIYGDNYKELQAGYNSAIDPDRPDLIEVQFAENDRAINVLGGELEGALEIRDTALPLLQEQMDTIARGLIENLNRIHSQGNGIAYYSNPIQSTNAVSDPNLPLDTADLPFDFEDGSFDIVVYDNTGAIAETITVPVTSGVTTLQNIADAVNGSANMTAAIDSDGYLTLTPAADTTFTFSNDTSGMLVSLGINGFFNGSDASTIAVNPDLAEYPALITSTYSLDSLETGDNEAALEMAMLRSADVLDGGTQTIMEYYEAMIVELGVDSQANVDALQVQESFVEDFEQRRQEVSGVNLDEEVTYLIQFQRAFEASARIITVTDQMLQTVVNLVQ